MGEPGVMEILLFGIAVGMPSMIVAIVTAVFWWKDQQKTDEILKSYKEDMDRLQRYYENNISLVQRYAKLTDDFSGIISLNTQILTRLSEQISSNAYCPINRFRKGKENIDE